MALFQKGQPKTGGRRKGTRDRISTLRRALRWSPLIYLGQISYGIYLWHFPIAIVVAGKVGHQSFGDLKTFSITAVATLLIASCSYYLIELRFLKMRYRQRQRSKSEIKPAYAKRGN